MTRTPATGAVRALAVGAALAALGGCETPVLFSGPDEAPPCPTVRVIGDGDRWVGFREGAPAAPENVALEARIVGFEAECEYDDDEDPAGGMVLSLAVLMGAERDPAAAPETGVSLPFFVAAVGPDRTVASKAAFAADLAFDGAEARVARGEAEEIDLRFPANAAARPWEYEVLIGFQLDRAQLDYERLRQP